MRTPVLPSHSPASEPVLVIEPLPWPAYGASAHRACRRHGHRCAGCEIEFVCEGPDQTGFCVPVCPSCCWIELGKQLRVYQAMVTELIRKRALIEQKVGKRTLRKAKLRRDGVHGRGGIVTAAGTVMLTPEPGEEPCDPAWSKASA